MKAVIITSRSPGEEPAARRILRSMDIDMTRNPVGRDFDKTFKRTASYRNGAFFSSGQPKGQMLDALLKQTGYTPDAVLLIDDQAEHVNEVMRSMLGGRISYHGFLYAKLIKNAGGALLDDGRARVQLKEFLSSGTLPNDCYADKLVARDPVSPAEANRLIYGVDDPCTP